MKFKRQRMVRWYDARQLAFTGIKSIISSMFGNFADKREMEAALESQDKFDYSEINDIWVDYISDLGDGFNSTYTMAHLMAQNNLIVKATDGDGASHTVERGKILIMGGDQVYPTPEKEEYVNRLQGPYNAAYPWSDKTIYPHLYAIPGNHDWYDGLANFMKLFCQGRALGNWHTQQKRSYFAIKLAHGYWFWGTDVQLDSDIDKPQLDYFQNIADQMNEGDKIILCTAEPTWVYRSIDPKNTSFDQLKFFKDKFIFNNKDQHCKDKKRFHLVATLTGDLHHYSRYVAVDGGEDQLITAGGGGAFMHPTHFLKDKIKIEDLPELDLKKTYPPKSNSRKIAFWNLLFPFTNYGLTFSLGVFHLFTTWFLQSTTKYPDAPTFMECLNTFEISFSNICPVFNYIRISLAHNPIVILLNIILFAGLWLFTDTSFGKGKWNLLFGIPHAVLQVINLYFLVWLFARINLQYFHFHVEDALQVLIFIPEMVLVGGFVSATIFGIYLLMSVLLLEAHPTEAFSSLRGTGYKHFLRIHIHKEGLTIYPIGVRRVVKDWKDVGDEDKPRFTGSTIQAELIEEPIHLK